MNKTDNFELGVRPFAVVTGASSGLGAEFAKIAAREGFRPILVARREERLRDLARKIKESFGIDAVVYPADLAASGSVDEFLEWMEQKGILPEVLVNDAGFGDVGSMLDAEEEKLEAMVKLNVLALTRLSLLLGRQMRDSGRGRILNVASTAAFQPCPGFGVYAATKAYVLSFTESLSEELRHTGVTATAYCPGPTATEFGKAAGLEDNAVFMGIELDKWERRAEPCAEVGWAAMNAGRTVKIDGWLNALVAWIAQISPRILVRWTAGAIFSRVQ